MNVLTQRPGVYSSYSASSVISGRAGGGLVGLVARSGQLQAESMVMVTNHFQAATLFGEQDAITELCTLALENGARAVAVIPVDKAVNYAQGFLLMSGVQDVSVVICDSDSIEVQQTLRDSVVQASAERKERIAVVATGKAETVQKQIERARALNCERVVLVSGGGDKSSILEAAAVAGAIAGGDDPAIPLGGAELLGENLVAEEYLDNEMDLLIQGGVTVLEELGGIVRVVRGVTTKTKNGEAEDSTWRELSTVLITDDVIPAIRASLKAKFTRAKNTAQSRSAIKNQVVLELEAKKAQEIITGYENVAVQADESDPTICKVSFSFTVSHGLNQIWILAHIAV